MASVVNEVVVSICLNKHPFRYVAISLSRTIDDCRRTSRSSVVLGTNAPLLKVTGHKVLWCSAVAIYTCAHGLGALDGSGDLEHDIAQ